jgi:amino acid adenylation domain-containing protein
MKRATLLHQFLEASAKARPGAVAVDNPAGGQITYRDLNELSDRLRDRLVRMGVRSGDRVGVYLTKSIDAVASIFGVLKTGAAYVPVDPHAPASRNAYIFGNCEVKAIVLEGGFVEGLQEEGQWPGGKLPPVLSLDGALDGKPLKAALDREQSRDPAPVVPSAEPGEDGLAYILYTSGSTGRPKGVMLTHRNGVSYVDWCTEVFEPRPEDRFSSHAPFHFDLSILDIYVPMKHGATLVLIGYELGKEPVNLAPVIAEKKITVWYSTPSTLTLLAQYGNLAQYDYSALRMVFFAGEVFPVKHLRAFNALVPAPRYFNLYGPTETNVCTAYEVPKRVPEDRTEPYPIGKVCSHLEARVVDENGRDIPKGEAGELCIYGPSVTQGYWNLPEQTANVWFKDGAGRRWYRTGDIVTEGVGGEYVYRGRRDRMVKKRGYRVELGEIEASLYRHPSIHQAAVVAKENEEGVKIKAFVSARNGEKLSIISMKKFCSENLPIYMVPDVFSVLESLPTTSTDKVDYQRLKAME